MVSGVLDSELQQQYARGAAEERSGVGVGRMCGDGKKEASRSDLRWLATSQDSSGMSMETRMAKYEE